VELNNSIPVVQVENEETAAVGDPDGEEDDSVFHWREDFFEMPDSD
jgi:hypothetical protein